MTGYISYDAHTARLDDFHRRAAEHRRAAALGGTRRRIGRIAALVHPRRVASTSRAATTPAC